MACHNKNATEPILFLVSDQVYVAKTKAAYQLCVHTADLQHFWICISRFSHKTVHSLEGIPLEAQEPQQAYGPYMCPHFRKRAPAESFFPTICSTFLEPFWSF